MTPAELGAGRERPGATVVAPRDRGARCLPRGASHRPAAGLRGEARPGRQFPSPSGLHPAARAGTTGCTPLFFYSHSPRALCCRRRLLVPGGAGLCERDLRLQQNNNKKPRGSSERPGPVSASRVPCRRSRPCETSPRVSWALRAP